jgi:hypothetical protein
MLSPGEEKTKLFNRHSAKLNVIDYKILNPSQSPQLSAPWIELLPQNHNRHCCTKYNPLEFGTALSGEISYGGHGKKMSARRHFLGPISREKAPLPIA